MIYKNSEYEVIKAMEPIGKFECYAIKNNTTGVNEAYISQLARAKAIADMFESDLKLGYDDISTPVPKGGFN